MALAKADGDLRVKASWLVHVSEPKLTVTMTGPQKKLVGGPVKYKITVVNAGTSVLTGVELFDDLPPAPGWSPPATTAAAGQSRPWLLGDAPAGQGKSVTVELAVDKAGETVNRAMAKADRSVTAGPAEAKTLFGRRRNSTWTSIRVMTSRRSAASSIRPSACPTAAAGRRRTFRWR